MKLQGLKINFLGDSITEGCGTSSPACRFSNLIDSRYGAVARCYGIGGTRIARQSKPSQYPEHDRDFICRVSEMDADVDVVVVFGGTNDFDHGDASFGCASDCTPYTFCGALNVLFAALTERYPAACIIVATPLHRLTENQNNMHGKVLTDYVAAIRDAAARHRLPVIDLFEAFAVDPKDQTGWYTCMADPAHPNDTGHLIIAEMIASYIESL